MAKRNFFIITTEIILLVSAVFLSLNPIYKNPNENLEEIWQKDIENLKNENKIPKAWNEICTIEKSAFKEDFLALEWIEKIKVPISLSKDCSYKIEIFYISEKPSASETSATIFIKLIRTKTNELLWELDRNYILQH
jgi:hypothetical protein